MHDGRLSVLDPGLNFVRAQGLDASQPSFIAILSNGSFVTASGTNTNRPRVNRYSADASGFEPLNVGPTGDAYIKGLASHGDTLWVFRSYDSTLEELVIGSPGVRSISIKSKLWLRDEGLARQDKMQRTPNFNDVMPLTADDLWIASNSFRNAKTLQAQESGSGEGVVRRLGTDEWNDFAKSVLEIINSTTGQPIAGGPTPLGIGVFIDREHPFAIADDSKGRSVITIYRLSLKR